MPAGSGDVAAGEGIASAELEGRGDEQVGERLLAETAGIGGADIRARPAFDAVEAGELAAPFEQVVGVEDEALRILVGDCLLYTSRLELAEAGSAAQALICRPEGSQSPFSGSGPLAVADARHYGPARSYTKAAGAMAIESMTGLDVYKRQ